MGRKKKEKHSPLPTPVLTYVIVDSALGWSDAVVIDNVQKYIPESVSYGSSSPYLFFYMYPSSISNLEHVEGVRTSGKANAVHIQLAHNHK